MAQSGPEGCLSIPDARADVERAKTVVIRYTDPATLQTVRDTVSGYTAVIFQHETDHLEGVLFTDFRTSKSFLDFPIAAFIGADMSDYPLFLE